MADTVTKSEIAELVRGVRNLLAFHRRCGLDYPRSPGLQCFLEGPAPAVAPRPPKPPEQSAQGKGKKIADKEPVVDPVEEKNVKPDDPSAIIADCRSCGLSEAAESRVTAEGRKKRPVDLFIVCDPPLLDKQGTAPIQGEDRELLVKMLAAIDLSVEDVYITGIIKCFPANKGTPDEQEIRACLAWLKREVDFLSPRLILTLGPLSAGVMLGTGKQFFAIRGKLKEWRGTPLLPSYHPNMLLKHNELKKASWEDLKMIRKMLSG